MDVEHFKNPTTEKISINNLYRILWRWHFYAGVFAIPFMLVLSITGAIYLFRPQIDAFNQKPLRNLVITGALATVDQQLHAALAAVPGSQFAAYELPREQTDAVNILVNKATRQYRVYVHPQTLAILEVADENAGLVKIVHDLHGELLIGTAGSIMVELAACWTIVLILTGLYLWWPRRSGFAGVFYPRLTKGKRVMWRDLHAVTGIWIAFFVLFLLVSGLPWTFVWGNTFKELRQLTGAVQNQDWNIAGTHHHDMEHSAAMVATNQTSVALGDIVQRAQQLHFTYPVLVSPPSPKNPAWLVKSNTQNRMQRADASFDPHNGNLLTHQVFSTRHPVDRIIGIGIAAHEGQLFGWLNQLLGLLTALGLLLMSVAGFILWRKRAPANGLGAPPAPVDSRLAKGFIVIIVTAAIVLPLLGMSLLVIMAVEKLLLPRWPGARAWLGV